MSFRKPATLAIILTVFGLSSPVFAQSARDFTATAVQTIPEQPDQIGQIAKSGSNMRFEYRQNGSTLVKILRPTEGVILMLDPQTQTYIEFIGPAVAPEVADGPTTPCPEATPETEGLMCERSGGDVSVYGVQAERWLLGYEQQQPQVILWDPLRRKALRQEFPEGSLMSMSFNAMVDLSGRQTEYWTIDYTTPGQEPLNTGWWFDPVLRVVVREDLPGGGSRRLENIQAGPVDPALFEAPAGWQKQDVPATPAPISE